MPAPLLNPMRPSPQEMLAGLALLFMGGLAMAMTFNIVPHENHDYMLIMLGALGGAIGVTGGGKAVSAMTYTASDATITQTPGEST